MVSLVKPIEGPLNVCFFDRQKTDDIAADIHKAINQQISIMRHSATPRGADRCTVST